MLFGFTIEAMATYLNLVGLLCLCGFSLSQECAWDLLLDIDFPGSDIKCLYSPDAEHCQHLCTQHPSCLFFTFVRPDWTRDDRHFYCYLKSTSSRQPNKQISLQGVTSGFSLKSCNPNPHPCLPKVYHNVDFPGADYRSLFTSDYGECQRACTHDPACQFFTFVEHAFANEKIRYKCHLKFGWTVPKIPEIIPSDARVSGFSQKIQITQNIDTASQFLWNPDWDACKGELFQNTNIPGHDEEVLLAVSPEHCRAHCSVHPRCTHFSYVSNDFKCYLKNNPHEMGLIHEEGVTSGLPVRFCQLDNSWIKKSYEGIALRHNDIRFLLSYDVETCQRACTEDPNCQYYTYVTERFPNPVYRRRCYLKRVITMPAPRKVTKLANVVSGFSMKSCYFTDIA